MQIVKINKAYLTSPACTPEILVDIAKNTLGMQQEEITKLAKKAKLVGHVIKALQTDERYNAAFEEGNLEVELQTLPDLPTPGANAGVPRQTSNSLKGPYVVVRKDGLKATEATDPGKWRIWQHVWNSTTFEQYFAAAPKKEITRTQRTITASSEIGWAVKSAWIVPLNITEEQLAKLPPATQQLVIAARQKLQAEQQSAPQPVTTEQEQPANATQQQS